MAASLLGSLDQLINQPFVSTVADRLGENPQNVSRGIKASATSILAGLANKSGDSGFMSQAFSTITNPSNDFRSISEPSKLADVAESSGGIGETASRFVGSLFGDKFSQVTDIVSRSSGLSGSSGSSIMRIAAPMVLGLLSRVVRERGLDLGSFTQMLSGEKDNIMRAAPAGLSSVLGERPSGAWAHEREVHADTAREHVRSDREDYARTRQETSANRPRWIWPAVVVLALLALFWGARGRARHVPTYDTAAGNVAAPVAPTYDTSTMPNTTSMAPTTGQIRLPDGTTLNAAPNGVEVQLATFIANPGQQPSSASSFDFDHVSFADNSAQLQPQSQDQLNNVAKILTAYPNVNVKIAGYMGAGGNASANKQLATQRASAVREALIKDGVPANRITSEGQAAQHPIANNATAPGSNQRVAIIVTKK